MKATPEATRGAPAPRTAATFLQRWRRRAGWLAPGLLLVLMPKCVVCLAGYAALAAGLGVSGRELCGAGLNDGFFASVGALLGFSPPATEAAGTLVMGGCMAWLAIFAVRARHALQGQGTRGARHDTVAGCRPATRMAGRKM